MRPPESAVKDIIEYSPEPEVKKRHILSVLVDDEPGILSKISGMISSRGFNIESLAVSKTEIQNLSRMTIILNSPEIQMTQARRQIEDLVNVWAVLELKRDTTIERELLMCKVGCVPPSNTNENENESESESKNKAGAGEETQVDYSPLERNARRSAITDIVQLFDGRVINVGTDHVVAEVVAEPKKIDAILSLLVPFGVVEAVRSGSLAMSQSKVTGICDNVDAVSVASTVDESELPPG